MTLPEGYSATVDAVLHEGGLTIWRVAVSRDSGGSTRWMNVAAPVGDEAAKAFVVSDAVSKLCACIPA